MVLSGELKLLFNSIRLKNVFLLKRIILWNIVCIVKIEIRLCIMMIL